MPSIILTATAAASFISSLGINTHLDFQSNGYQNLTLTAQAITYLGVVNLRDSGQYAADVQLWSQIAKATGAKFDDYMPEGSTTALQNTLAVAPSLASAGVLNFIEGGDEEDDSYAISNGDSLGWAAQFQHQVYQSGQTLGLPVINMSFGSGWTATNNWQGDYAAEGDLSAYCNYGNAHTYPGTNQTSDSTIQRLNGLAKLAAASRPVITSEIGWSTSAGFTQSEVAQYVMQAAFDGLKDGNPKTYFYALFDDSSGSFGLMNSTGTPRPAGTALHNLTTLLADTSSSTNLGQVSYSLAGAQGAENTLLLQKSDGSYWLAVWDETDPAHNITLTLQANASEIQVFDPVTSTTALQAVSNAATVNLALNNDPLIIKVVGLSGASSSSSSTSSSSSSTTSGSTSGTGSSTGTASPSTSNDLAITVPGAQTIATGTVTAIKGVSINDAWAATQAGSMALNLSTTSGAVLTVNGQTVSGTLSGSLAQLNSDLATLSYKAGAIGTDTIRINVWNQGGVQTTQQLSVNITASTSTANDLAINVPGTQTVVPGSITTIAGVSISDPWAASRSGSMALNLSTTGGGTLMVNGQTVTGTLSGSLAQLNADLATLSYKAGTASGSGSISVNVWNQGGVQTTKAMSVAVTP